MLLKFKATPSDFDARYSDIYSIIYQRASFCTFCYSVHAIASLYNCEHVECANVCCGRAHPGGTLDTTTRETRLDEKRVRASAISMWICCVRTDKTRLASQPVSSSSSSQRHAAKQQAYNVHIVCTRERLAHVWCGTHTSATQSTVCCVCI